MHLQYAHLRINLKMSYKNILYIIVFLYLSKTFYIYQSSSSTAFGFLLASNLACWSTRALLLILSTYSPNEIYFSLPSGSFSSSPKMAVISLLSSYLPYLTKRSWRVSSTETLPKNLLSYMRNWTRLKSFLGSRPVLSEMHLLYMTSYSSLEI